MLHLGRYKPHMQFARGLAKLLKMTCNNVIKCIPFVHCWCTRSAWSTRAGLQLRSAHTAPAADLNASLGVEGLAGQAVSLLGRG